MTRQKMESLRPRQVTMYDHICDSPSRRWEKLKRFMASENQAPNVFLNPLSRVVYFDTLEAVKYELLRGIKGQPEICKAVFNLPWELDPYLKGVYRLQERRRKSTHSWVFACPLRQLESLFCE
jgi:hypothetical protein